MRQPLYFSMNKRILIILIPIILKTRKEILLRCIPCSDIILYYPYSPAQGEPYEKPW